MANNNETNIRITASDETRGAFASVDRGLRDLAESSGGVSAAFARLPTLAGAGLAGLSVAAAAAGAAIAKSAADAIDMADNLNDLSQRTGVSIQTLTAYKLAADQSGTSLEAVAKGIKGLSGSIIENGKALRAAGIDTQSAASAMNGIADLFANMPDGVEKTALATKLFGKAGMDLIPMLNGGSQALKDSAEKTERLGAIYAALAPNADKFNDTLAELKVYASATGASIANDYLPSLVGISSAMAEAAKEGSVLDVALAGIGRTMAWVFSDSQLPRANQIARQLKTLRDQLNSEIEWGDTLKKLDAISGMEFGKRSDAQKNALNERMLALHQELDKIQQAEAAALKARGEAGKKAAEESAAQIKKLMEGLGLGAQAGKAAADPLLHALDAIREKSVALGATLATETVKELDTLSTALARGKITAEEYNTLMGEVLDRDTVLAAEQREVAKTREEMTRAQAQSISIITDEADKIERETELRYRLRSEIEANIVAQLENTRAIALENGATAEALDRLDERIAAYRRLRDAVKGSETAEAAKKAADESAKAWEKFTDDIERSLTDSLMRGFESGKGFGETFVNSLKNTLKAAALKVVVQAIVDPVMGTIRGATGFGGGAGASGGYGDPSQSLGFMSTLANGNQAYYSAYSQFAYSSVGQTLGLSGNVMGPPTAAGQYGAGLTSAGQFAQDALPYLPAIMSAANGQWGSAIGSSAGAYFGGPIGSVIGSMIGSMFDGGGEDPHNNAQVNGMTLGINRSGAYGLGVPESGNGTVAPMTFLAGPTSGSGWWGDSTAMSSAQIDAINKQTESIFKSAVAAAKVLGVSDTGLDAVSVNSADDGSGANGKIGNYFSSIDQAFAVLSDEIAATLVPNIRDFQISGESLAQTLNRVVSNVQTVDAWSTRLGLNLSAMADKNALADLFGGTANMSGALDAYYQAYYSAQERQAHTLTEMSAVFDSLNVSMPSTKEAFRALVSGLDLSTESGRATYATLIGLSGTFAQVMDAAGGASASVENLSQVIKARQQWQDQLDVLTGTRTQQEIERAAQLAGTTDAATQALMQQVFALQDQQSAATSAAEAARQAAEAEASLAQSRQQWQDQLDVLTGARTQQEIERTSLLASTSDTATQALMRQVFAMQDQQAAATAAAQEEAILAQSRQQWQDQLDVLTGAKTQQQIERSNQLAGTTDETTKSLMRQVFAQQDLAAATSAAAAAVESARASAAALFAENERKLQAEKAQQEQVTRSRFGLEIDLLNAVGKKSEAVALQRAIELVSLDKSLVALKKQVWAAEDAAAAQTQAAESAKAASSAWLSSLKAAFDRESGGFKTTIERFRALGKTIREFGDQLRMGQLAALSPEAQYYSTRDAFFSMLDGVRSNDAGALDKFRDVSQAYLEASKRYNATGAGYFADLEQVKAATDEAATHAAASVDVAQLQLDALKAQVSGLIDINSSVQSVADLLRGNPYGASDIASIVTAVSGLSSAIADPIATATADMAALLEAALSRVAAALGGAASSSAAGASGFANFTVADAGYASQVLKDVGGYNGGIWEILSRSQAGEMGHVVGDLIGRWRDMDISLPGLEAMLGAGAPQAIFDYLGITADDYTSWSNTFRERFTGIWNGTEHVKTYAKGGLADGWAIVGEEGRELVNFSSPGRVYTARETQGMLSGGDSGKVVDAVTSAGQATASSVQQVQAAIVQTNALLERLNRRMEALESQQRRANSAPPVVNR